jgi:hypothetical protein
VSKCIGESWRVVIVPPVCAAHPGVCSTAVLWCAGVDCTQPGRQRDACLVGVAGVAYICMWGHAWPHMGCPHVATAGGFGLTSTTALASLMMCVCCRVCAQQRVQQQAECDEAGRQMRACTWSNLSADQPRGLRATHMPRSCIQQHRVRAEKRWSVTLMCIAYFRAVLKECDRVTVCGLTARHRAPIPAGTTPHALAYPAYAHTTPAARQQTPTQHGPVRAFGCLFGGRCGGGTCRCVWRCCC